MPALEGLVIEAVEWLPSGSDAGLVRVRGRWTDPGRSERELPALGLRRGQEARRFDSLPDARFGRDPAVWRATYLVPAALMDPPPDELWLVWDSGVRAGLPAPAHGFEPPATPPSPVEPERGGEVIDRAVLAERRARRAEAAERAQAQRAAEALKAVEVLELRSAELERRLEALQAEPEAPASIAPPAAAPVEPAPPEEVATAPPQAEALATAVAAVKRLRAELADQRQRVRRSELLRAADAVALASLRDDRGRAEDLERRLAASEHDLGRAIADAEAATAGALAAREQAAEQVALAQQRAAADAAAVRARAAEELAAERERAAAAQAAVAEARAELEIAGRDLAGARDRLSERERELAAIGAELARLRDELERVRGDAAGRAADLERRLAELDAALAAERRAHAGTATELETARAQLAHAEAANRAESVARAALDEALDAAQTELVEAQTLQADLVLSREQARAEGDAARGERDAVRGEAEELRETLAAARSAGERTEGALAAARQELEAARLRIAALERELEARQGALASAEDQAGGLLARIAELERTADQDLERRAREQAEAAASAARQAEAERDEVSANLDAAAAALRARADEPAVVAAARRPGRRGRARAGGRAGRRGRPGAGGRAGRRGRPGAGGRAGRRGRPPSRRSSRSSRPAARAGRRGRPGARGRAGRRARSREPAPPPRPRIVTESSHPARGDLVGTSKREYPWLRGALVKLAHDDPRAATRLLLGLVPVQRALVTTPVEYDLTIRDGGGTYAISIGQQRASAKPLPGPRPRSQAAYHVSADVVTLAELLAGVDKRMGRWFGSIKVRGRRRGAEALRDALVGARLDLAAAARAGAELDPDLVFRAFAYAIHPAWTKGHRFTVAQEIADPSPQRWHIVVRDGAPVAVERRAGTPRTRS